MWFIRNVLLFSVLKTVAICFIFFWKPWYFWNPWWIQSSKEQHLFEREIFYNIMNFFYCHFCQFNASLLNKSNSLKNNFLMIVYVSVNFNLSGATRRNVADLSTKWPTNCCLLLVIATGYDKNSDWDRRDLFFLFILLGHSVIYFG